MNEYFSAHAIVLLDYVMNDSDFSGYVVGCPDSEVV